MICTAQDLNAVQGRSSAISQEKKSRGIYPSHIQRHQWPMHLYAHSIRSACDAHRRPNLPKPPMPDARMPALLRCISRGDWFSVRGILSSVTDATRGLVIAGIVLFVSGDESCAGSGRLCSASVGWGLTALTLRFSVGDVDCARYGGLFSPFSSGAWTT